MAVPFTQISLFAALLCGRYGGVVSVREIRAFGNLAIATMDRLDGEVVMVDGVVYQMRADGTVRRPADDESVPFATIAAFVPERVAELDAMESFSDFERRMDALVPDGNVPIAIRVSGSFSRMRVRSVRRQDRDGVGLAVLADGATKFELADTRGELVGFRLPGYLRGINAPGWHLHYIDGERRRGGHVINFCMESGRAELCAGDEFRLRLPANPAALAGLDLSRDRSAELRKAEAER